MQKPPSKLAYMGEPHLGGTYTVFLSLRSSLAPFGYDVRWVGVSDNEDLSADALLKEQLQCGEYASRGDKPERTIGKELVDHIRSAGYTGVFINIVTSKPMMNIARYLPEDIVRVMIVHGTSVANYAAARSLRSHVHATACVSPRIRDDLLRWPVFDPQRVFTALNAIDMQPYRTLDQRTPSAKLRVLFLGRIDETAKGVFWIPDIIRNLPPDRFEVTIAGGGPELDELKKRCADLPVAPTFLGRVTEDEKIRLYKANDVFLMTSRHEGFAITLAEALAAGCVPVTSRIRGVTDFVVTEEKTGLVYPMGDCRQAAECLRRLADDPERRLALCNAAHADAMDRFDRCRMGDRYAEIFDTIRQQGFAIAKPLPLDKWAYPRGLKPGLRRFLPEPVKNVLRKWRVS